MRHGSLFSGIGGFDLAAEWMGWENVFHCEWNEFGQKVIKHYWPKAISYNDITTTDFTIHRGNLDILTGGFPCQPYSQAGKRLGKADERHLWPHMLRSIREIQPTYVVAENVRGLVNWNGGMVFDEVQADLEASGYEVTPFLLPACGVNAPHNRMRVWFVAKNTNSNGWTGNIWKGESSIRRFGNVSTGDNERICSDNGETISHTEQQRLEGRIRTQGAEGLESGCEGITPDTDSGKRKKRGIIYREWQDAKEDKARVDDRPSRLSVNGITPNTNSRRFTGKEYGQAEPGWFAKTSVPGDWQDFPTQPPICGGDDGISRQLDGITFPKWRNETIKAYGNAIVPQVALQIFKAIQKTHARL